MCWLQSRISNVTRGEVFAGARNLEGSCCVLQQKVVLEITLEMITSTYTHQKAKSRYRNGIRLERASQRQSSGVHQTPYDRVKRYQERKPNIKASERVNGGSADGIFASSSRADARAVGLVRLSPALSRRLSAVIPRVSGRLHLSPVRCTTLTPERRVMMSPVISCLGSPPSCSCNGKIEGGFTRVRRAGSSRCCFVSEVGSTVGVPRARVMDLIEDGVATADLLRDYQPVHQNAIHAHLTTFKRAPFCHYWHCPCLSLSASLSCLGFHSIDQYLHGTGRARVRNFVFPKCFNHPGRATVFIPGSRPMGNFAAADVTETCSQPARCGPTVIRVVPCCGRGLRDPCITWQLRLGVIVQTRIKLSVRGFGLFLRRLTRRYVLFWTCCSVAQPTVRPIRLLAVTDCRLAVGRALRVDGFQRLVTALHVVRWWCALVVRSRNEAGGG
ncbi:hypothetical protein PR048_025925 [Dryococelus australis]|uniref:Uncharacterized protein n=1 Tax=Dryococelus australis TaxID=614101 RepID=A0ABQ9GJW6_9NEOP|nr:hypothetical protein PR048_025925 [Dryococelus australis]